MAIFLSNHKNMKFEDYLRRKADQLEKIENEDNFNHWLERLDVAEVMAYAERWGAELVKEARELGQSEGANRL